MLVLSVLSIDHTQRNISLNESSRTFLFRRSGELDSQLFPKRGSLKTHTTTSGAAGADSVAYLA